MFALSDREFKITVINVKVSDRQGGQHAWTDGEFHR